MEKKAISEITTLIRIAQEKTLSNKDDLERLKRKLSKRLGINLTIKNSDIVKIYKNLVADDQLKRDLSFEKLIKIKEIRTGSGVAPVAILTKPYPCPGKCTYCPAESQMPKSYLSNEPAVMRAINNKFDPFLQVSNRLSQYQNTGHLTDKIELIILGGTFTVYPQEYKRQFIKRCFDACNGYVSRDLTLAQKLNEETQNKIVCLSIETRPDEITEDEIMFLRRLGATKIQLGVQTTHNHILDYVKRDHRVEETIKATRLLKDAGFKICYHLMTNLPLSTPELDFQAFKEIFSNPDFKPDGLKIYPCVVLKEAELFNQWLSGEYIPYSDEILLDLLLRIKMIIPEFIRVDRIYRDIPKESVMAGSQLSNIRQILKERLCEQNISCRCIRCREIKTGEYKGNLTLNVLEYSASQGKEYFLSYTDENDKLSAILRLRIPFQILSGEKHFIEELQDAAIIREMHTYGTLLNVGNKPLTETQHRGLGTNLLLKAEEITRNLGIKKLAVIAGVGVRNYFRKYGYKLEGTYMVKSF